MQFLLESPWTLGVAGGLLATAFLSSWFQSGRPLYLGVGVVATLLTVCAVAAERLIVTEREEIRSVLEEISANLEAENYPAVIESIHPTFKSVQAAARSELPRYEFEQVEVKNNLKVKVVRPPRGPATATASFNMSARVSSPSIGLSNQPVVRFVELTFERQNDRWLITDYSHSDFRDGLRTNSQ